MTERAALSIEVRTPMGIAMMVQVLSGILIIGTTGYFGTSGPSVVLLVVTVSLYLIGFIQLLLTRYIMQREKNGILVAIIVAFLAMIFSLVSAIIWGVLIDQWIPAFLYIIVFAINLSNGAVLNKQRSLMSS